MEQDKLTTFTPPHDAIDLIRDTTPGIYPVNWHASTASTNKPTTLTIDDFLAAKKIIDSLPVEPFRTWMLDNGADPERGWSLVLPAAEFHTVPHLPPYVRLSHHVPRPTLIPPTGLGDYTQEMFS